MRLQLGERGHFRLRHTPHITHAVPMDRKVTLGPKQLQQFPKGSPQREIGLELLKSGVLQLEDGATQLLKLIRLRLGKDLQQDVSEHFKRFLHSSARLYQQSMQHYVAEESNLHERALQAVKSVTTSSKTETETETDSKEKEIIADVLRGFSSVGKRGTHWFRTGVFFWRCWKKLRVQSHCKRVERKPGATTNVSGAMTVHCRSTVAYTGQQKTMNGQKQTTIVKNRWILGHPNGMTPKDMMMNTFPKKLTGPRIITRPATTTTTTTLSPNTVPHFWTNLSKHRKKTRANLRLYKKRWLQQTQQQT